MTEKPDLGGKEADDNRLLCEAEDSNMSCVVNAPGTFFLQSVFYPGDAKSVNMQYYVKSQNIFQVLIDQYVLKLS